MVKTIRYLTVSDGSIRSWKTQYHVCSDGESCSADVTDREVQVGTKWGGGDVNDAEWAVDGLTNLGLAAS